MDKQEEERGQAIIDKSLRLKAEGKTIQERMISNDDWQFLAKIKWNERYTIPTEYFQKYRAKLKKNGQTDLY